MASIRVKITLFIILIAFVITATNFFAGLYFTNRTMKKTLEEDLAFAIGIVNDLVGAKMNLIKTEAITMAEKLSEAASNEDMRQFMERQINAFPHILGLAVFDRGGLVVNYSIPMHFHGVHMTDKYLDMMYGIGATMISSPFYCSVRGDSVMDVVTPMEGGRFLAMTISGQTFTDMLSKHKLWRTGHIFMLNEEGMFVGATYPEIASALDRYAGDAGAKPDRADAESLAIGDLVQKILSTESGVGGYRFQGVEHLCAYRRIADSPMGWRVAV
ncbi:MAG: cache domain-containing protein, partial [Planctomycetota bacterium]|nr:cache domain-containing protein [Planctomycetota bacterium]